MTPERLRKGGGARLVACLALAPSARPEARQRGPDVPPRCVAASRTRLASERTPPPPQPPTSCYATGGSPRCGTRRTRSSGRHDSGDWSGIPRILLFPALPAALRHSGLFLVVPRGKQAWGVRDRPLKKRPSISASFQVRVPVTPSTQRREVRALIRSPILRSDDVVTDEALGRTCLCQPRSTTAGARRARSSAPSLLGCSGGSYNEGARPADLRSAGSDRTPRCRPSARDVG